MADYVDEGLKKVGITISKPALAAVCIIFGLLVILLPNLLVWIVGLFLMIQGALLLTDYMEQGRPRTTETMSQGVYCHECGGRNPKGAIYCARCGVQLARARQMVSAQPQVSAQPERVVE